METPRRPGQRPAKLPTQPLSQPQPPQPQLSPSNDTSFESTTSSHRRQYSPYYFPHFPHPPPPFFNPYHYPISLYPYMPPLPPPPLYPFPQQPQFMHRPAVSRSREPAPRYRERENRTFPSSSGPSKTTHVKRYNAESSSIRLHDILKTAQSLPLVWLLTHLPKQAQIRRSEPHYSPVESLGQSILSQPATDPPIHRMRIVSNDFIWEISIEVRPPVFINVETVLFAIYAALHQLLTPSEWKAIEEPNVRRSAHWARCSRLAKGEGHLSFNEEMSGIRRIDLLGDKVAYKGLARLSSSENGSEFLLQLGSAQTNDKRTRMRRGSF